MGKLGSYSRQNKAATALGEMGRIEKTIFVLDSISNEALRRCSVHCSHVFNVFLWEHQKKQSKTGNTVLPAFFDSTNVSITAIDLLPIT